MLAGRISGSALARRFAWITCTWCAAFAALHLYWAVGGDAGLASAAGADLATRRPPLFVWGGLWGWQHSCCSVRCSARRLPRDGYAAGRGGSRPASDGLSAPVLLARGVIVELVLLTGASGVAVSVGPSQTRWSLVLWNPWFMLGGIAFLLTAHEFGKPSRGGKLSRAGSAPS